MIVQMWLLQSWETRATLPFWHRISPDNSHAPFYPLHDMSSWFATTLSGSTTDTFLTQPESWHASTSIPIFLAWGWGHYCTFCFFKHHCSCTCLDWIRPHSTFDCTKVPCDRLHWAQRAGSRPCDAWDTFILLQHFQLREIWSTISFPNAKFAAACGVTIIILATTSRAVDFKAVNIPVSLHLWSRASIHLVSTAHDLVTGCIYREPAAHSPCTSCRCHAALHTQHPGAFQSECFYR